MLVQKVRKLQKMCIYLCMQTTTGVSASEGSSKLSLSAQESPLPLPRGSTPGQEEEEVWTGEGGVWRLTWRTSSSHPTPHSKQLATYIPLLTVRTYTTVACGVLETSVGEKTLAVYTCTSAKAFSQNFPFLAIAKFPVVQYILSIY